jgi:hypothetical protein
VPQFRPKAMLERSAAADLSKNTLSRIPTLAGRLIYLASLRDPDSGVYRHHGLASIFGREESRLALCQHHEAVFQEWLRRSLEDRMDDLSEYLDSLQQPRRRVIEYWKRVPAYRGYIPASARESERELFFAEFEVLVETLGCPDSGDAERA